MGGRRSLLAALLLAAAALAGEGAGEPPDARFNRAERLFAAGDLEKAYELYESVAKADPGRWGARAAPKMFEIRKLVSGREEAKARVKWLNEAEREFAAKSPGELAPWLRYEAARGLYDVRLYTEAAAEATVLLEKYPESRHRAGGILVLAGSFARLGRVDEAVKAYRQLLAAKGAARAERAGAWRELGELLSGAGRSGEHLDLLEEQVRRGPEEPGAEEAAERFFAAALAGPQEAARASKLAVHLVETWPAGSVRAEWVLLAAKIAEYVERDWARADRLYRLVLDRYPQAAFDVRLLEAGRRGADAGRELLLAAVARVAEKQAGRLKELAGPAPAERGASPEKALAAVLVALRAGDAGAARSAAAGELAGELAAGRAEFARFGLSDFRVLGAEIQGEEARVEYEVSGELGVTRVLKRKARAVREAGAWKIAELGL